MRSRSCSIVVSPSNRRTRGPDRLSCGWSSWRQAASCFRPHPEWRRTRTADPASAHRAALQWGCRRASCPDRQPWPCPRRKAGSLPCASAMGGRVGAPPSAGAYRRASPGRGEAAASAASFLSASAFAASAAAFSAAAGGSGLLRLGFLLREALAPRTDDGPVIECGSCSVFTPPSAPRCAARSADPSSPGGRRRGRRGACRSSRASDPRSSRR